MLAGSSFNDIMTTLRCVLTLAFLSALAYGAPTLPEGLVRTPSGVFPAECVHSIPSGATVERNPSTDRLHVQLADGTLHAILPKCDRGFHSALPSNYDGWEAYVSPNSPEFFRWLRHVFMSALLECIVIPCFQLHCVQRPSE
jgi:hypothetical protein